MADMQQPSLRFTVADDSSEPAMGRVVESMFLSAFIIANHMDADARSVLGAPTVILPGALYDWAKARLCSFNGSPPMTVLEEAARRFPGVACERAERRPFRL